MIGCWAFGLLDLFFACDGVDQKIYNGLNIGDADFEMYFEPCVVDTFFSLGFYLLNIPW